MSICNECWGKGWIEKQGVQFDCRKCKGTGVIENEPMTNEEYLRTCTTEQLAKWIQYVICHCKHCNADNAFLCQFYDKVGFVPCVGDGLVEWLKQPHSNE